ncbi:MAG: alpha/beta fold hydrolase [Natronospirillum sp.]|uniref:peptidoglycan DD-metalloendopeptidase family protein n=1 Tax=Natronospirillum sp. TaxID=2812955 RepID=UPI0025E736E0|nr:peptidoglycan DD-metalloendopeptidase family protein [Natronospirillum sp.]MCH8551430.1 alpha/beta fold hydrolase [Natronospirillum sp.]
MKKREVLLRLLSGLVLLLLTSSVYANEEREMVPWFGKLESGGHLWIETPEGTELEWQGSLLDVYQPRTLIGFSRDEAGEFELVRRLPDGEEESWTIDVASRTYREQRVEGVPSATVSPSEEQLARIAREAELTLAARDSLTPGNTGVTMPFAWPLHGRITAVYGSRRWYNGEPGTPHWGIDIASPTGTPVRAPADGLITLSEDLFLSGETLFIDHGQRLTSALLHLSERHVEAGDWVRQGDVLGLVGATGRATGPHLDWRLDLAGQRIDAALWVPPMDDVCTIRGDGDEVVILLHGLGRTSLSMEDMALALRNEGFSTCNQGYPSRDETIQNLSSYVASAVQHAREEGKTTIHFVTHSMGGIILRYYLGHSSHAEEGRVVMLAPPNQGSEIVDALDDIPGFEEFMGPAVLQLSTDPDSVPNQLPPIELPVGVIAGDRSSDPWFDGIFEQESDGKVTVESTRMTTMTDHRVMPVGHTFMMHSRDVHAEVIHFLQNGAFK